MIIKKLNTHDLSIEKIAALMSAPDAALETLAVTQVNWPESFPYKPEVKVRIAHNGDELLLQYEVKEKYTMGKVTQDNGEVWTDSCCECFISFDENGYYNLETTCIGKALF
ncbi:MAG: carbohydrate-binding family 9-like protein, partial [Bacteroidales bacterium]